MRYRSTTVRLNESRGSEQYHSTNSSIACRYPCRYPRWASADVRLFRTAVLPGPDPATATLSLARCGGYSSGGIFASIRGPCNHESILPEVIAGWAVICPNRRRSPCKAIYRECALPEARFWLASSQGLQVSDMLATHSSGFPDLRHLYGVRSESLNRISLPANKCHRPFRRRRDTAAIRRVRRNRDLKHSRCFITAGHCMLGHRWETISHRCC